ncbi:hypothetical protein LJ737_22480 [Hymenobacter sp. 15J16-1T3B]|uniref:hypothetical protein n=1 Tax=Hymenobacter sp. 15J16-1T3B TaxID=2886941 RepID=UPI001D12070D|nr:hypothetical protein [Hymenobacter sp. 15J16-1T3B]MCC3160021.1 hypothetical protein [Hymenobacter sp. 15J16-1T3B]
MPEQRRGMPNWVFIVAGALVLAVYLFSKFLGQRTILKAVMGEPGDLVNRAMQSAKISPRITSRTGEITARNFKVKQLGAQKDTSVFQFFLQGERADATIKLWMIKRPSGQWDIIKTDTLFSATKSAAAQASE